MTTKWFIYIPEEGDWSIDYDGVDKQEARKAYLTWANRSALPKGSVIWKQ